MLVSILVAWTAGPASAEVELPSPDPNDPIVVTADAASRWKQGAHEVWVLRGGCRIAQGPDSARSRTAVLWIDRPGPRERRQSKVIAYLEDGVTIERNGDGSPTRLTDRTWLGRLYTAASVEVRVPQVAGQPEQEPAIYQRGMARRQQELDTAVRRAQHTEPIPEEVSPGEPVAAGTRRISVYARSDVPFQFQWKHDEQTNQWIALIDQGVNLIVEGLSGVGVEPIELSSIDVSTDRLVIWTSGIDEPDLTGQRPQPEDVPLEIYMEGNIVFREENRVIYAERMYYDVNNRIGIVLDAELLTPVPNYEGLLRLKSDILQQISRDHFLARNTFITSSRLGRPGYRIQTSDAYVEDNQLPVVDPMTGAPVLDPETGSRLIAHQRLATGWNNFLYVGELPVFYWPYLATDLTDPTFYVRRVRIKNDSVFGTQILTNWDGYELFGIRNKPEGTDWDISLDYLSERGFGHGTTYGYVRDDILGIPGPTSGLFDFWGIQDRGADNLGRGRRFVPLDKDYRYRLFWQHRHLLPNGLQLSAELGWISDRNFLEQYYEREWDELKDQITGVELKRLVDNSSWSITADYRINDFFTQTDWLPRADHFWLGQPLLGDVLTWYEHTHVGYARFHAADTPDRLLPWERTATLPAAPLGVRGERLATRHEIDLPLQLGPFKVVPYALGEAAHWGKDRYGDDVQRVYGQAGVRASLPVWKVNPAVQSELFNLTGLAHKIVFDLDVSWSDANRDLTDLPLYDPLDDDSIEAFRRRFPPPLPALVQLDERFYALRTGLAGWVTSPSPEIADDLLALRLGMRQRWQTKRGTPGRRRIIDWITLDTHAAFFPKDDRDNFGEVLGLVDYDFRWHVGDRLTLLSEGGFDFFDAGQQVVSFGGFLSRPPRGSLYAGIHLLEGPFSSDVLSLSYSYRMSDKWVSSFGMSVDLGGDGNIGQNFSVTRIGESLLISAGMNVDASRDNVGVNLSVEPRFLPKTRLGQAGGARIPVAGAFGLE